MLAAQFMQTAEHDFMINEHQVLSAFISATTREILQQG
ncbi:hypothetical protein ASAP_2347 [Asaia bogorensis]|uniref:Uncharacterized protein n=1 Tax=Asaia bogorensis TaxID=91915 RepID=A0A060QLJ2_9PROT|nr:hypothetical protein ASAP_2347 [Asaia bogorensis]